MKLVILIVLAIVLLAGGGFATWWFLLQSPPEGMAAEHAAEAPVVDKMANTTFIPLEPFTIPLIRNDSFDRFLIYELTLVVPDDGTSGATVRVQEPRLRDAFRTYIHSLAAIDIEQGVSNLEFLRGRLLKISDEVVGKGVIRDILFVHAFERPVR